MNNPSFESFSSVIKQHAATSEELKKLHPDVLKLVYNQNWFKLYVPKEYGGLDITLPEILRLLENIAQADGSTSWVVTLCSGASWFAGFLDEKLISEIFTNPEACITGSGAVTGTATKIENGYLINGSWRYSSGAHHATHFTANCTIKNEDGSPVLTDTGEEQVLSFLFKKEEVRVLSSWSYVGMVATGSHGFEINNLTVPQHRSFEINSKLKLETNANNYPFLQLAETTLAVNFSGMALHFIELTKEYMYNRTGIKRFTPEQITFFESEFEKQRQLLDECRKSFYTIADISWNEQCTKNIVDEATLQAVSAESRKLVHTSRRLVDTLYPFCGLEAAKADSELNRVWRDIHTASQHSLLTFEF